MLKEMDMVFGLLEKTRPVSQIHFGGGTPNYLPMKFLKEILTRIKRDFSFKEDAEVAIECDPNLLTRDKLKGLKDLGFNRISFGLQDFNREVLKAVNRKFPAIPPGDLISQARELGFTGINMDLIYGLPKQTAESFSHTLEQTMEAGPDRVAVFGYAHVPWQKPHQQALEKAGLPSPEARIQMAVLAHNLLTAGGYLSIGMDHYAKPGDELALALKQGLLHRNFQGYCTRQTTGQVYGFGASAITQLYLGYGQNRKDTEAYIHEVSGGGHPVERMYRMTEDDLFYREVINGLMCQGHLDERELAQKTGLEQLRVHGKLVPGLEKLKSYVNDGLIKTSKHKVEVTPKGWLVVRCVAMLFDPLLEEKKAKYSRTV
jgi:oxygen-independent coproporphyrinogen-3 oxidase